MKLHRALQGDQTEKSHKEVSGPHAHGAAALSGLTLHPQGRIHQLQLSFIQTTCVPYSSYRARS